MDVETATLDEIEEQLIDGVVVIAQRRASQMVLLREVDRRQAPTAAGCRSLAEWVAGRLDVALETGRDLAATTHRVEELPDVVEALESGEVSFDRAVAMGRFAGRDGNLDVVGDMAGYDIAGIRSLAAKRRRVTRADEECAFADRYLIVQPNLDESAWRLHGRFPGIAGQIVVAALEAKTDRLPDNPSETASRAARNADALWAISLDALCDGDGATIDTATPRHRYSPYSSTLLRQQRRTVKQA